MRINHILVALLITGIFGLNYSAIKLGLGSFDPLLLAGLRFSLCTFPAIFFAKKPVCSFKYVAVYGVCISLGLWRCCINQSVEGSDVYAQQRLRWVC
jgi:O-acetylserine/cysteine efflux transporter